MTGTLKLVHAEGQDASLFWWDSVGVLMTA